MVKVVLHIGTHKTATTLIQDIFANNREILRNHNIIYPEIGTFNGHHMLASEWISLPKNFHPKKGVDHIWNHIRDAYANTDKTIVLSSEEFSRSRPTQVDMKQLRERLSFADTIEVVCSLRDQYSLLQSTYLEIAKNHQPPSPSQMYNNAIENQRAHGLYLNYNDLYDHLLTGFSKTEITFISFNDVRHREGGILGYFLELIGYEPNQNTLSLENISSNISADPLSMWITRSISTDNVTPSRLLKTIQSGLEGEFGTPLKTSLFSLEEIQQLNNLFDPLNQILCERISDQQPDFKLSPMDYDKELPNRNNISAKLWRKLRLRHTLWIYTRAFANMLRRVFPS